MKIYHIIAHTLEPFFPEIKNNINSISNLDHAVNKFIKSLIKYDTKNEHILICLSSSINSTIELNHKEGYKIIIVKSYYFFYPIEFSYTLINFCIKNIYNNDIIHIHGISSFVFDSLIPFLVNKKTILHYRGGFFTWKSFPISFIKYIILLPINIRLADFIIIENKKRLNFYHKYYFLNLKKLIYIPGFINNNENNSINKEIHSNFNIIFVGRLEKAKGILDLIYTFINLQKNYPNIILNIAGIGTYKEYILKISKQYKNIKYYGFLEKESLEKLYKNGDIFVLPTYYDSFGLVLIEAIKFNLPIITTNTEGPSDIIDDGENGFLINPGDKVELEHKIIELYNNNNNLRNKFTKNAQLKLKDKFSEKKNINKILTLYSLLAKKELN